MPPFLEDLEERANGRYRLLARGRLSPSQVLLPHDAGNVFPVHSAVRAAIEVECSKARELGRRVEQNPLRRYLAWSYASGALSVQSGDVDYEAYFGLSHRSDLGESPVVVTIAAATEVEGNLVLEKRGQQVAQGPGLIHVKPSGHVHPHQTAWQAVQTELQEELGISPSEIQDAFWMGLVRSSTAPVVTLLFSLRTSVRWDDMLSRSPVDAWEHEQLMPLRIDPEVMHDWLLDNFREGTTGPGHASVLLEGWSRFGEDWYDILCREIEGLS